MATPVASSMRLRKIQLACLSLVALGVLTGWPGPSPQAADLYPTPWSACEADNCPVTIPVINGSYSIGTAGAADSSQGTPQREVTIPHSFAFGIYEITRGQFAYFVRQSGYVTEPGCLVATPGQAGYTAAISATASWREPGLPNSQTSDDPVVCVNWNDAHAYVDWLNQTYHLHYRLLSETEWEYLARGGSKGQYWWDSSDTTAYCMYANTAGTPAATIIRFPKIVGNQVLPNRCADSYPGTSPDGYMGSNNFQAFDILGNAEEWVQDCYTSTYDLIPVDGTPYDPPPVAKLHEPLRHCVARVVRGGSWKDDPGKIGVAIRSHANANERTNYRGFRIAHDCAGFACQSQSGAPYP